jgi:hypothetical protein
VDEELNALKARLGNRLPQAEAQKE